MAERLRAGWRDRRRQGQSKWKARHKEKVGSSSSSPLSLNSSTTSADAGDTSSSSPIAFVYRQPRRACASDLELGRLSEIGQRSRYRREREQLIIHSIKALQKTQRLWITEHRKLGSIPPALLIQVDAQDVLHCLRSGAVLDMEDLLASSESSIQKETTEVVVPADLRPSSLLKLADDTLVLASYEVLLLSYALFAEPPDPMRAGHIEVLALQASGLRDLNGGSDPSPKLRLLAGGLSVDSGVGVHHPGCHPPFVWPTGPSGLEISVDGKTHQLLLEVFDMNSGSAQHCIGHGTIDLTSARMASATGSDSDDGQVMVIPLRASGGTSAGELRMVVRFQPGAAASETTAALRAVQSAFGISEMDHDEILSSLTLPVEATTPLRQQMSDEMLEKLNVRLAHQQAVPVAVQIEMCPHFRLLLLQNKRPRDFDSDHFFEEWQRRQLAAVVESLLQLVRKLGTSEREELCGPTEPSRLADVEESIRSQFAQLIAISSSFKVSAGFPENEYTRCLDQLYERATKIYKQYGVTFKLDPLPLPSDYAASVSGEVLVPAAMWHTYDVSTRSQLYTTLCAATFGCDDIGRLSGDAEKIMQLLERTRVALGISKEEGHLCAARLYFDEFLVSEAECNRDPKFRQRTGRYTMLQLVLESIQMANTAARNEAMEQVDKSLKHRRNAVLTPIRNYLWSELENYHAVDHGLLPLVIQLYLITTDDQSVETKDAVRQLIRFSVVRLYEIFTSERPRPFAVVDLGYAVDQVLKALDTEIRVFEEIWRPYNSDSTVIFLKAIGSKIRHDYENCACPDTIDDDVVDCINLLQMLENRMLKLGAIKPAEVILAHADARHGAHAASPFSKLLWRWLADQGAQLQRTTDTFVDHETWESIDSINEVGQPLLDSGVITRTSYSIRELFTLFNYTTERFLSFRVASHMMYLCLVQHIIQACINYANGLVEACGDCDELMPPLPPVELPRRLRSNQPVPPSTWAPPALSNSAICVRINNIFYGMQHFMHRGFFSQLKEYWFEVAGTVSSRPLDNLINGVLRNFELVSAQLVDYLGCKLVYCDLRDVLLDGLYLPSVEDSRVDTVLEPMKAAVQTLNTMLDEPCRGPVRDSVVKHFYACFRRVLIDGGPHRIYRDFHGRMFEEDYATIRKWSHNIDKLIDQQRISGKTCDERILDLLKKSTESLVKRYDQCQWVLKTDDGDTIFTQATVLRVVSHRVDKEALRFLKRVLKEEQKRQLIAGKSGEVDMERDLLFGVDGVEAGRAAAKSWFSWST
eukprot:SAG31_NODE_86_length_26973_cov_16.850897_8_plen_1267_part_00